MKPAENMTLNEIRYLVHVHVGNTVRENLFVLLAELEDKANQIISLVSATPLSACDCAQCEEVQERRARPPRVKITRVPPKKISEVHFSLD